jgi:hypothetical protein
MERSLLVASDVLGELVESCRRLVPQTVDGLEPDEVRVLAGDVLSRRESDVP